MRTHVFTLRLKKNGGGSHQNLQCFIRGLRRRGNEITLHTMFEEGNEPPPDIPIQSEKGERLSFLALQQLAADAMKKIEREADAILVYGQALMWGGGIYRLSGGHTPVAVYLDSHLDSMREAYRGIGFFRRLRLRVWETVWGRTYIHSVGRFLFVSPYLSKRYARLSVPAKKQAIIPNAFDFTPAREPIRHDVPRIIFVGRLSFEKGPDLLVEALSQLTREKWDARFVGDGPMRTALESAIRSHELQERVQVVGWKDRAALESEFAAADIFVLPSRVPEPFGRSVVEALQAGLPVIIPRQGGAAWVAGESGVVFENGNATSLAAAIEKLLRDSSLCKKLGELGEKRARDFDVSAITLTLERELTLLVSA